jgi:hypothetical protein
MADADWKPTAPVLTASSWLRRYPCIISPPKIGELPLFAKRLTRAALAIRSGP